MSSPSVPRWSTAAPGAAISTYYGRVSRLASALAALGCSRATWWRRCCPTSRQQAEAHFGVPACGAVLNTINIRLDPETVAYIFEHGGAKVVLVRQRLSRAGRSGDQGDDRPGAADRRGRRCRGRLRALGPLPRLRGAARPGRPRRALASCPRTNGNRSRSTTPPAPPAGPRAWSITTAAPIWRRWAMRSRGGWCSIRST